MNGGRKLIKSRIIKKGRRKINVFTCSCNKQTVNPFITKNKLHKNKNTNLNNNTVEIELNHSLNFSSELQTSNNNSVFKYNHHQKNQLITNNMKKSNSNSDIYKTRNLSIFQIDNISSYNKLFASFDCLLSKANNKINGKSNLHMFNESQKFHHSKSSVCLINSIKLYKEAIYNNGFNDDFKMNKNVKQKEDIEKGKTKQRERLKEFERILEEEKQKQLHKQSFFEKQRKEDKNHSEAEQFEQSKRIKIIQDKTKERIECINEIHENLKKDKPEGKYLALENCNNIKTEEIIKNELTNKNQIDNELQKTLEVNNSNEKVIQISNELLQMNNNYFVIEKNNFCLIKKEIKEELFPKEENKRTINKDLCIQKLIDECNNKDKEKQNLNLELSILKQKLERNNEELIIKIKLISSLKKEIQSLEKKLQLKSQSLKNKSFSQQLVVELSYYTKNNKINVEIENNKKNQSLDKKNQQINTLNKLNYGSHKIHEFYKENLEKRVDNKSEAQKVSIEDLNLKNKIKLNDKQKRLIKMNEENPIIKENIKEKNLYIPNGKEKEEYELENINNNTKHNETITERQSNSIEGYSFKQFNLLQKIDKKQSNISFKKIDKRDKQFFEPGIINFEKASNNNTKLNRNRSVGSLFQIENNISKRISFLPIDNIIKKVHNKNALIKEHSVQSNTFVSYHKVNLFKKINAKNQKTNHNKIEKQRFEQSIKKDSEFTKEHAIMPVNDFEIHYKINNNQSIF